MRRKLIANIGAEVLAALWAMFVFSAIPSRISAAMLAGLGFVLLGIFILARFRHEPLKNRLLSYWAAYVHLFIFSAPMLAFRLLNFGADFSQVRILWWTGPEFHRASEVFYLVLVLASLADLIRFFRKP